MPTYKFKCQKCSKLFETTITLADYEARKYRCPKCNSKRLKQQIYAFAPHTSKHVKP